MAGEKSEARWKGLAYVISQIGGESSPERSRADEVIEFIIEPVVSSEPFRLRVQRSDRDPKPGQVTSAIVASLIDASLVVADLTGRNANVYYELGVVHSFARPVVVLVDTKDSLSFDTEHERVIQIGDSGTITARQADNAKKELRRVLEVVLAANYKPTNLVTEVATAKSLAELAPTNPIAAELASLRASVDELKAVVSPSRFYSGRTSYIDAAAGLTPTDIASVINAGKPIVSGVTVGVPPITIGSTPSVVIRGASVQGNLTTLTDQDPTTE